jgi:hypothetical protein
MANLLNQNIGTNYKGILNLNTLNGNLSGTLQAVTDGDGNASLLKLSTTEVDFTYAKVRGTANAGVIDIFGAISQDLQFWTADGGTRFGYITAQSDGIEFLASTSRFLSFGAGNAEGMRLTATRNLAIGTTSASARLHVRGDGTNPIARFENSAGANFFLINNSGQTIYGSAGANEPYLVNYNGDSTESGAGQSLRIRQRANVNGTLIQYWADGLFNNTTSGTNISHHFLSSGYAGAAGNGLYRAMQIGYTINNSGAQTGTATGIFLNATETALNGMEHNLMDLQVGGNPKFTLSRTGLGYFGNGVLAAYFSTNAYYYFSSRGALSAQSDGVFTLLNNAENGFGRLQFGGTTNAFPSIKRSATSLHFRLADDSAFAPITSNSINLIQNSGGANQIVFTDNSLSNKFAQYLSGASFLFYNYTTALNAFTIASDSAFNFGDSLAVASARVQIDSTTQGFLPPRMTTSEVNSIASPAEGLVVFNTTISHLCVYQSGGWVRMSHSPM